ncbi:MAG: DUF1800 family protein [Gammaproteobacteria bacterium]
MNKIPFLSPGTPPGKAAWLIRCQAVLFKSVFVLGVILSSNNTAFAIDASLSNLVVQNLSPAFDPAVKDYTIPKTDACSVPVTATLADPSLQLYVSSNATSSGATVNTWICGSQPAISIVVYENWTEVNRYTVTPVEQAPPPPPPPPVDGKLTGLTAGGLSPAFDPDVTDYTVPMPANCSVPVSATVADPDNPNLKLYISSTPADSGATVNTWVCGNQPVINVVVYDVWTEVGHYTITPSGDPVSDPDPNPPQDPDPTPLSEPNPTPEPDPVPPGLPAMSVADQMTAIRFLEQASFGPTAADIAAVQSVGLEYWMAQQANLPAASIVDGLSANEVANQLFQNMYSGQDQLRQRMMFALSQIVVVSSNKNINGEELIPWVRLLSKHAFGNYRSFLREVSLSPTMGKYLDLANSFKATASTSPNENYARELMQLFSIGLNQLNQDGSLKLDAQGQPIPTYDQQTLREIARALTGWTYPTQPGGTPNVSNWEYFVGLLEPRPQYHDYGAKTLLNGVTVPAGQTVTEDLDAVLDNLFQHPNTPPFVATRLIRSLVTSNPTPGFIQRVADVFADNGQGVRGDLWAVLVAILTDTEATGSPSPQHGHLKDPVLHVMNLGRALGAQVSDPGMFMYIFRNLGQGVLSPATVFSFYSPLAGLPGQPGLYGPEFQIYSPGLAIQRANFIYDILNGQLGSSFSVDLTPFTALAGDPDALVEQVNQTLLQGRMSNELRQTILAATQATGNNHDRALGALYLAAISSEYSVQR